MSNCRHTLRVVFQAGILISPLLFALPTFAVSPVQVRHGKPFDGKNRLFLSSPEPGIEKRAELVTAEGLFTFPVSQVGDLAPSEDRVLGQYGFASSIGSIGFIAHNHLAGSSFSSLSPGTLVTVSFNDGSLEQYVIETARWYQASDPDDFSKPFINETGVHLSTQQVFSHNYKKGGVTFQTCIRKDGFATWGVLFVIAAIVK